MGVGGGVGVCVGVCGWVVVEEDQANASAEQVTTLTKSVQTEAERQSS